MELIPGAGASVKDEVAERIKEAVEAKKARPKAAEVEVELMPEPALAADEPAVLLSMGPAIVLSTVKSPAGGPSDPLAESLCSAWGTSGSLAEPACNEGCSSSLLVEYALALGACVKTFDGLGDTVTT